MDITTDFTPVLFTLFTPRNGRPQDRHLNTDFALNSAEHVMHHAYIREPGALERAPELVPAAPHMELQC